MTFLERVDMLIDKCGITRNTLSKEIDGITHGSFYAWETRGNIPSGDIVKKLADRLKTTSSFLLGETDNPINTLEPDPSNVINLHEKKLMENYRTLNQEGQEKVLDITDDLVKSGKYAVPAARLVARSTDHHGPREITAEQLERVKNAPNTDEKF